MRLFPLLAVALLVVGCGGDQALVPHSVALATQTEFVPEGELLDVGVVVFDPGVPEGEVHKQVEEELLENGTYIHIRRTEARFMAVHLRDTLKNSGHWGAVWTTPWTSTAADINVTAQILRSDGERLRLRVRAEDATGRVWIEREYAMTTAEGSFDRGQYPGLDPYQDVFNRIANDLAAAMDELSGEHKREVRTVAQLRFAAELSPEAFAGHVLRDGRGRYTLNRLPAQHDPQFERIRRVRDRERLFVETLNRHYVQFYEESKGPYHGWRETARAEAVTIRELERDSRSRIALGILGMIGSVLYALGSDGDFSDRVTADTLMYMSTGMIESGFLRREEKQLHSEALEELSASFDAELEPMVVEIDGIQHRFSGTAEAQYEEWRGLLRQIFEDETGLRTIQMHNGPSAVGKSE